MKTEAHAAFDVGDEAVAVLARERNRLDRANARTGRCSAFYEDVKTKFGRR